MQYQNQRNPVLPLACHVPDGEAHVMPDGKLYLYGSYDLHSDVYCSEEYHVVSTPDLKHWEIEDTPDGWLPIYYGGLHGYGRYDEFCDLRFATPEQARAFLSD